MLQGLKQTLKESWPAKVTLAFLLIVGCWWVTIYARGLKEGFENNLFTVTYPWVSLWGGIWGVVASSRWGGWKSIFGRALLMLSVGLLLQTFGQAAYSFYIYVLGVEVPYPSIGDIGYFGTSVFYVYGLILLAKAVGVRISARSISSIIPAILIPLAMLILAYTVFLQGYEFDSSLYLTTFLDFGYPTTDAIYVSIAIVIFLLSRKFLGGIMRSPTLFLLVALIVESVGDYMFPYQVHRDLWYVGGINDFTYLVAYSLMALALIQLGTAFKKAIDA